MQSGMLTSPIIAATYLVVKKNYSLEKALQSVTIKRLYSNYLPNEIKSSVIKYRVFEKQLHPKPLRHFIRNFFKRIMLWRRK